jgi:hypothetical protein
MQPIIAVSLIIIICVVLYACLFVGADTDRTGEDQP